MKGVVLKSTLLSRSNTEFMLEYSNTLWNPVSGSQFDKNKRPSFCFEDENLETIKLDDIYL